MEKRERGSTTALFAFEARERAEIPPSVNKAMRFVDSHVHLSDYPDPEGEAWQSAQAGLELFAVSIDKASSMRSLEVARIRPRSVRAFVGIHPSEAVRAGELDWFGDALRGATGCGEIGLDPSYSDAGPGSRQAQTFELQLQIAERAGKAVQVHSRGAENDCLQALSRYSLRGVLLHWFEGENVAKQANERGYYFSFGPALLYSRRLQRVVAMLDRGRVLTESDGPVPYGPLGGVRGPALVPSVVFKLAELWKMSFDDARAQVIQNQAGYLLPT